MFTKGKKFKPRLLCITWCLPCLFVLPLSAKPQFEGLNEPITLNYTRSGADKIVQEIDRQSDFFFTYSGERLAKEELVNVHFESAKLSVVLEMLTQKYGLHFLVKGKNIAVSIPARTVPQSGEERAQAKGQLTGTVTDGKGTPLPGASVRIKELNIGAGTDADGHYRISLPVGTYTVIASFVAFGDAQQQVAITTERAATLDFRLEEELSALNEVVVMGYSTQKRKDVSGSVTTVRSADFNRGAFTDVNQLIQGKVSGLVISKAGGDPNQPATVRLRGVNSLTGSNTPLYVIDGVVGADINMVPTEEIASFDILKDAATASIYGARAANGVIIITTKKGSKERTNVSYSVTGATEAMSNYIQLSSAADIKRYQESIGNTGYQGHGGETDWFKAITRRAWSNNHTLSLYGGGEKTTYRGSVAYLNKQGIIMNSGLERWIGRFNLQQKALDDRLNLGLDITANQDLNNYVGKDNNYDEILKNVINADPSQPIRDANGNYNRFYGIDNSNVVSLLDELTSKNRANNLRGTLSASLRVYRDLTLSTVGTYETKNSNYGYYAPSYSIYGLQNLGQATALRRYGQGRNRQLDIFGNYNHDFIGRHHMDVTAGYSYNYYQNEGFEASGQGFVSDAFLYDNLALAEDIDKKTISSYRNAHALSRLFSRINYNYASKYYLTLGFTRDGSTRFGSNNRYGNFPSISGAWRLSQEAFFRSSWVNDLKLKASYGISGTLPPDNHNLTYLPTYSSNNNFAFINGVFVPVYSPSRNANPDLQWEKQKAMNLGVEFSLFDNRISGTLEYYNNTIEDLLYTYNVPVPPNVYGQTYANVGSMRNRGIDIQLSGDIVRKKDFRYHLDLVASLTRNKVLSITNDQYTISTGYIETAQVYGDGNLGYTQRIVPGHPIGSFYTYEYAGLTEDGHYLFYNQKGEKVTTDKISSEDKKFVGRPATPPYQLGLNHIFSYKNWGLTLFFNGQFGNSILNGTYQNLSYLSRLPSRPVPKDFIDAGITQTDPYISSLWLESGSFLRLQNAALSYKFNTALINKLIKGLQVSAMAENLFILTSYKGIDPEVKQEINALGIDNRNYYPKSRSFMVNLQVTF